MQPSGSTSLRSGLDPFAFQNKGGFVMLRTESLLQRLGEIGKSLERKGSSFITGSWFRWSRDRTVG